MIKWSYYTWNNVPEFVEKTEFPEACIRFIEYMNVPPEDAVIYALNRMLFLQKIASKAMDRQHHFEHASRLLFRTGASVRQLPKKDDDKDIPDDFFVGELPKWTYKDGTTYDTFEDLCLAQGWDLGKVYHEMSKYELDYNGLYANEEHLDLHK